MPMTSRQPHRRLLRFPPPGGAGTVRRGSVLYVVLVVIALLTLAAYQFSEIMRTESLATHRYGRRIQVRALTDSGVEVAALTLGQRQVLTNDNVTEANLYHNPGLFGGVLLYGTEDDPPRGRGRYSLVSPVENDETATTLRFGLADESGKLNLNALGRLVGDDEEGQERARNVLLTLPGMTNETADAILDWIDEDDEERQYGAEYGYYEQFGYEPRNGPLQSLDELLLIRGVTPQLVYGFDANRNGIIDAEEAQAASAAADLPPLGWMAFLTVHSRESNRRLDGSEKININDGVLSDLYDRLVEEFAEDGNGEDIAQFIVAYRMNGPANLSEENQPAAQSLATGNNAGGGNSGGRSSGDNGGISLDPQAAQQLAQGIARSLFSAGGDVSKTVTRGGMNLAGGARFTINSLYDLIDAEVEVEIDGVRTTLQSPWTSDNMAEFLPSLLDRLTTVRGQYIQGRININEAREEVLTGILSAVEGFEDDPNLAADLARKIVSAKMIDSTGAPLPDSMVLRASTAWLVTEGHVTLQQMRQLDRYLTTRGDVFRAQVIGYFDDGGPATRTEVILDATQKPPRLIFQRDLTPLGKGFTPQQLGSPIQ